MVIFGQPRSAGWAAGLAKRVFIEGWEVLLNVERPASESGLYRGRFKILELSLLVYTRGSWCADVLCPYKVGAWSGVIREIRSRRLYNSHMIVLRTVLNSREV